MGSGKSECAGDRNGQRCGHRSWQIDARIDAMYLMVPEVRLGYIPFFVTNFRYLSRILWVDALYEKVRIAGRIVAWRLWFFLRCGWAQIERYSGVCAPQGEKCVCSVAESCLVGARQRVSLQVSRRAMTAVWATLTQSDSLPWGCSRRLNKLLCFSQLDVRKILSTNVLEHLNR